MDSPHQPTKPNHQLALSIIEILKFTFVNTLVGIKKLVGNIMFSFYRLSERIAESV